MVPEHKQLLILLILMLLTRPLAAGLPGCVHADVNTDMEHNTPVHHQHDMTQHQTDNQTAEHQDKCSVDCKCSGMCLHIYQAPSVPSCSELNLHKIPKSVNAVLITFSVPGYTFPPLRPPAISS